ncbi:type VI secretion system contractile sheath large subunit [Photobacterium alginatilyticum]|uniref:Type VI secretion system contractile sheath large subunit n=1 Tax=Photobacterium alginatilyticum TaxID=1775171 RepID=A0ABW9YQJ9_9GAMM|nr:type VI secretion system contractile sheath large subunit [Photobacterium alginatilyticum]NBI55964.1 type VI secretion system contractile sheath large subunit [Photobacterium alginatilyticum]
MRTSLFFLETEQLDSSTYESAVDSAWYAQTDLIEHFLSTDDDYWSLRIWLEKDNSNYCWSSCTRESVRLVLLRSITALDDRINDQVNAIIHHDVFQKLEASWRGLAYLTDQLFESDTELACKIKLLNLTWKELSRDINRAIEFDQSDFFKLVYSNEFNMPGGEPFGLLIGDYKISHKPMVDVTANDIDTLIGISQIAAASFSPFITAAAPSLFGVNYYSELASVADIQSQFSQVDYKKWQRLREVEDTRFLGLAIPHILMREPYKNNGSRKESFFFEEKIDDSQSDHLWGNAAYGFAAVALKAFTESGWFSQIRGFQAGQYKRGLVFNLPTCGFNATRRIQQCKPSVDLQVGDRLEKQLSDCGFIPVSPVPFTENLVLLSNSSVNQPGSYELDGAQVNARISSMLQYVMSVSRFAHYIKVMGRDKVGGFTTAESLEREFQQWLFNYTTSSDDASEEMCFRYPLSEARIKITEKSGQVGNYYSVIHLRPHFQLDNMVSTIRLVTELSPKIS